MQVDGYSFMADAVSKFHHSVYVCGWFLHDNDHLGAVSLVGSGLLAQDGEVGLRHRIVEPDATPGKGFRLQCLRNEDSFDDDMEIVAQMAAECGLALPQAEITQQICRTLKSRRHQLDRYGNLTDKPRGA